ncbi:unnamed protein product [Alternaria alternata]
MPRSGPPFREPITYFRWDAKEWIRLHRTGWSLGEMNTTIDTLWLLHPAIRNYYIASRTADRRRQPGLPAPNPIPARPYPNLQAQSQSQSQLQLLFQAQLQFQFPLLLPAQSQHLLWEEQLMSQLHKG